MRPPETLEELRDIAIEIKRAGLAEYPILSGYQTSSDGLTELWSTVYASGGRLFNDQLDPMYPDEDPDALSVLEWQVQAMNEWGILDPRGIELSTDQAGEAFVESGAVFSPAHPTYLKRANDPKFSNKVGRVKMMRYPGLKTPGKGSAGWTRMYAISAKTKVREAAWRLLYFLGGKNRKRRVLHR